MSAVNTPLKNDEIKALALALLHADTEADVVQLLRSAGLWDSPGAWRLYGDKDTNYATIGNQQSRPEAALVEKLINSVDARLLSECLRRGIDPESPEAPPSIRHAVARFFEGREPKGDVGGLLVEWPGPRQLEEAQKITLAVTGPTARAGSPSITIADAGEGQTPARMPDTFLSLVEKSNKLRIPFVQGKFNMGGTGVLKFCGRDSLELILSRRDPEIATQLREKDPTAQKWGFTVVRRERPGSGVGHVRNSVFKYLAPVGADAAPGAGQVLAFSADELEILPEKNKAYIRKARHGSVIKLYEYDMKGFKSHVLRPNGLLTRLEVLLPEIALPVRIHECRNYGGKEASSFANSLVGLTARLTANRAENLEQDYPTSVPFTVRGEAMVARIYAFKEDLAESYRTNEGIIFVVNGQTHGAIPKTFFDRSRVKMGRLAKSLLVAVDCSQLSVGAREDLFMNSRDRLSNAEIRKAIEEELEEIIGRHPGLKELRERRRSQEIEGRLKDAKPLEDVLGSILKSSPSLARLFLQGQRLSRPHRGGADAGTQSGNGGVEGASGRFAGKPHPTFFRFHNRKAGEVLQRTCELGRRSRIKFETDVENAYFSRPSLPGRYHIEVLEGSLEGTQLDHNLTLHNGVANWSVSVPEDLVTEGEQLTLECIITDDALVEPFVNVARLTITRRTEREDGGGERESHGGTEKRGDGHSSDEPGGLDLPTIIKVRSGDEYYRRYKFDDLSACKVVEDASGAEDDERSVYTFYVNVDNRFLRTDMKGGGEDVKTMEAKFVYGNVLLGLALIHDSRNNNRKEELNGDAQQEVTISSSVDRTTRALAPFLVPMIDYLGALSTDDLAALSQIGDDE